MKQKPAGRVSTSEQTTRDIKRKKRLAGDIVRQANSSEVSELRREARDLKEVVAD